MSSNLNKVEKSVEDILIELMVEKVMSAREQDSSTRGFLASPSTARQSGPSQTMIEK
jgi:hypothetical protein